MTKRKTTPAIDDIATNSDEIPQPSLLDLALAYYGLAESDVFVVRELAPGVLRIITVDARKFTYPEPRA